MDSEKKKSTRFEVKPVLTPGDRGTTATHPAYGMLGVSRSQGGGTTLFGTDFLHHSFMTIAIREADVVRNSGRDWPHGKVQPLIEVRISEAQWATFVSSPNVGQGVQCTIKYVNGEERPDIPLRREADLAKDEFIQRTKETATAIDKTIAKIEEKLVGLSGKKKDEILAELRHLRMEVGQNMPYMAKSFGEMTENMTEKAKIEVMAFAQNTFQRAGIEAIAGKGPLSLMPGDAHQEEEYTDPTEEWNTAMKEHNERGA